MTTEHLFGKVTTEHLFGKVTTEHLFGKVTTEHLFCVTLVRVREYENICFIRNTQNININFVRNYVYTNELLCDTMKEQKTKRRLNMITLEQIIAEEKRYRTEGGQFGINACKDSIKFEAEQFGISLYELLGEYVERANRDALFNRRMVLACWELINEQDKTTI